MHVIEIIEKKRDNQNLHKTELNYLIDKYLDGIVPDYQMSAFLMATCINSLSDEETAWLTDAMLHSGKVFTHDKTKPLIDKHSTGGVGDKTSIPLAPAVAACGLGVPMISGRGLSHTGGTLDKLEAIPGFRCDLTSEEYEEQVKNIGCVITGQTKEIVPADKMLYALRDVTGTVGSIPLIASSIMSKKLAEGIDGLVLDVKFGSGAFMKDVDSAHLLASKMVGIGAHMGTKVTARLTNMDQPLGTMIGNALEIKESIEILHGRGPDDTRLMIIELGAEMLMLGNIASSLEEGRNLMDESLTSGRAFSKFIEMVKAQGGDEAFVREPERLKVAPEKIFINAESSGYLASINSRLLGMALQLLGGGRMALTDLINHSVGIEMLAKIGDQIEQGQPICIIYADQKGIEEAILKVKQALNIAHRPLDKPILFQGRISTN